MQFGNYVATDRDNIQAAKNELLEGLIDTIRELAKQDKFWIVKSLDDEGNLLNGPMMADGHNATVGWKIIIPQMSERKPVQVISNGEVIGLLGSSK